MMRKIIQILLVFSIIFWLSGCKKSANQNVVNIYAGVLPDEVPIYVNPFIEQTGIKVNYVRLSAGEALARLKSEAKNPQATVWYGGTINEFIVAKNEGLLTPYKSPNAEILRPAFKDADGYWTAFYFGALGFAVNPDFIKRTKAPIPESWQDLLKDDYKGEITFAYPYSSGTAYTLLFTLVTLMGEDEAFSYMKELDENVHHYNRSGTAAANQVGLGEMGIGIAFSQDILRTKTKGYDIILSFPKEGTGYEIGGVALVAGAPNQDLGKRFIDYVLSPQHQDLFAKSGSYRVALHPQAKIPEEYVTADEVDLIDLNFTIAARQKDRLVRRWQREIMR